MGAGKGQVAYSFSDKMRWYSRVEYFMDPSSIQIARKHLASESLGVLYALNDVMNIGTEFRCFHSEKKAFEPYHFLFFQLKF